ncbi:MAG TPA: single-stranded DNA-binding protein [Actinomycetota bacterium]|nr:single-stranded DNA-binding protein [Actinomycetota bacterium]
MNNVSIAGNLTRDPELRYTPQGQAVANFSLAVNRSYFNRAGERVEATDFVNANAWGKLAENVAESLRKGNHVVVSGRLQSRQYETEDHSKRTAIDIQAEEVAASLRFATVKVTPSARENGKAQEAAVGRQAPTAEAGQVANLAGASFPGGANNAAPAAAPTAQQPAQQPVPAMATTAQAGPAL